MRLVTRCPTCRALFEVRERQLQACEGWLRCGQCFHAFDSTGLVLPWSPVADREGAGTTLPAQRVDIRSLLRQQEMPSGLAVDPVFKRLAPPSLDLDAPAASMPSGSAEAEESAAERLQKPGQGTGASLEVPVHSVTGMDLQGKKQAAPPLQSAATVAGSVPGSVRTNLAWALGCLATVSLLIAQLVQMPLNGLQLAVPAVQGWGQRLCVQLGCDWPAVRAPAQVQLDSARLLREEQRLVLSLRVRNTASVDVIFGALELSLLGPDAAVLVRRVLGPDAIGAPAVLAAGAVWEGRLQLQMGDLEQVQGYRALMFLP